jgi:hypothetical protein
MYVILFGVFVLISQFLQCVIPFMTKLAEMHGYDGFLLLFLNQQFVLPMDIICDFYAAITAAYVGVDRAAFAVATFKDHMTEGNYGKSEHILHIIVQNFIIYSSSVLLNMIFDVQLSLAPLAVALGSSVLLYVSGNKVIMGAGKLAQPSDIDEDGIDDSEQDQGEVLERYKATLKERDKWLAAIEKMEDDKMQPADILARYRISLLKKGLSPLQTQDLDEDGIPDDSSDPKKTLDNLKMLIAQGKALGIRKN